MNNTRWKSIQSVEQLEKFLDANKKHVIVDTGDKERRFYARHSSDLKRGGIDVDGRSVRALWRIGKITIHKANL